MNYEFLTKHKVILIFLDLLVSGNDKLIEHGITGICNYCHDPAIRHQLLEERGHLELIRNLLELNNPRILAPTLSTLLFLQEDANGVDKVVNRSLIDRVEELLKEAEAQERPSKLKNLLLLLKERFPSPSLQ